MEGMGLLTARENLSLPQFSWPFVCANMAFSDGWAAVNLKKTNAFL
jgi:hypothetical protein